MPVMASTTKHAWWSQLRHNGLLIASSLLEEKFPTGPFEPTWYSYRNLRERYTAFETWLKSDRAYEQGTDAQPLYTWLNDVLDTFLGHQGSRWEKGNNVAAKWKYETLLREQLAPHRILFRDTTSQSEPALFVWIEKTPRLGQGQGRNAYGKLLELLRAKNVKLGLLTNGRQFRLCYAGLDYDSWVEWDVENWFAEEELRSQLYGFYTLLGPEGMRLRDATTANFPLLDAAEASRTKQGELSTVLGEQVRQSVELLLKELNVTVSKHPELLDKVRRSPQGTLFSEKHMLDVLYQAAVRVIMRLVIIFFAEARDMLPRSLAIYTNSYGLEGLYEQLLSAVKHEGPSTLDEQHSAWARLLSLFTLIYQGSSSEVMPVHNYGGLLFRPGDLNSTDAITRAIAVFESMDDISDGVVLSLLKLLRNGKVKIKQGNKVSWVPGPVDFSELRTEYIGLLYQGLLDFNLHRAQESMVFLKLGQEPVLPLNLLVHMEDPHLKDLLKKLKVEKSVSLVASEEGGDDEEEMDEVVEEPIADGAVVEEEVVEEESAEEVTKGDEAEKHRQRALEWAKHAVKVGGLVKKPKGKQKDNLYLYEQTVETEAANLIKSVLDEGEFYLVGRGGTRKGSGTFYTKPQLAVPITLHTLLPLLYTTKEDGTRIPLQPDEILSLKVCDPACGSASFLVAALHYITDALYQSLIYHKYINYQPENKTTYINVTLPYGTPSRALVDEELADVHPDDERFEPMTKARLRRYVVERCIYGVDLSPLAVELARMSLWIETMDQRLPFTFLDHKIKVGNALVGTWFDTFREYPIMAWKREGGDKSHNNGVNYQAEEWTQAIKDRLDTVIKPQLIGQIESGGWQHFLFSEYRQQQTPEGYHDQARREMEQIHLLPVESTQEREERYLAMQQSPLYRDLKLAFDCWCALWFWPADKLEQAPTPANFYQLPEETRQIIEEVTDERHFFHWELEFMDVFEQAGDGFDVILANPPWEISKPYSKEFFSDYDLLYRTRGKQEALNEQHSLYEIDTTIERDWLLYQSYFKDLSNWAKHVASPFGDPAIKDMDALVLKARNKGIDLHALWRQRRSEYPCYVDKREPFRYLGSADLNTYKMFLESSHHLLKPHGHLGMLVPSGIYTDQGSTDLRRLFLDKCRWDMLFGFINNEHVFDIDSRFKFAVLLLGKGSHTEHIKVVFNQKKLAQLIQPEQVVLDFPRTQVEHFSPKSLVIVEIQTLRDFTILDKLYSKAVLLGDKSINSWQIEYANEFHMTSDSKHFLPFLTWQENGYQPDDYGRWINDDGDVALPLYEGRMVGAFDPCEKGWESGHGRSAKWPPVPLEGKVFKPQYLLPLDVYEHPWKYKKPRKNKQEDKVLRGNKIGFMDIGSATNTRSMYATLINDMPCGNVVPVIQPKKHDVISVLSLVSCLNSFVYDYTLRCRLGGLHLNYFVIEETPLIAPSHILSTSCAQLAARLNLIMPNFAPQWLELRAAYPHLATQHWRGLWAITPHERLRLRCILDAIVAELYGLEYDDLAWILRDDENNIKGFSPMNRKNSKEREKPKKQWQITLTLAAFGQLKEVGLEAFYQEDWQFPLEVAEKLGPRFTAWQEEGTVEESWQECEMHAQKMLEIPTFLPVQTDIPAIQMYQNNGENGKRLLKKVAEGQLNLWGEVVEQQLDLWEE